MREDWRDYVTEVSLDDLLRQDGIIIGDINYLPTEAFYPKPKPRSKQWRRPKRWRARDILEHRGVQGVGFRGTVEAEGIALRDESGHIDHDAVLLDLARSGPVYTHVFAPYLSEDLS